MTLIQNHPRFKQDVETFKSKINQIQDENEKITAEGLLRDLVVAVRKMDSMHEEMSYSHTVSTIGNELRENIRECRIKLDKKLKECLGQNVAN
jgi:hypothetical protein